ncbi:MAG: penicillin-binding transpeptidase domain-containing protein [Anaerovoracaceae bacterium]|jgi:penicillin-binding protein 2
MKELLKELLSTRYRQLLAVFLVLAVILVFRLLVVTVFEHHSWAKDAEDISTKTIYTTAPRGEIYDRNGKLLAGNKQSFTVKISAGDQDDKALNKTIENLLAVLNKNHDKLEDEFPIKVKDGKYYYTYDREVTKWLRKNDLDENMDAEQAFNALRQKLEIDPSLDRYDAQVEMQSTHGTYPPISVKTMKFTYEEDKESFLEQYFSDMDAAKRNKLTAKQAFDGIRKDMGISKKLSAKKARDIMIVRYALDSLGYNKYKPATVAKNVSKNTVMLIEEGSDELKGVQVVSETKRYYPYKNTASHILGYLGKINDSEKAAYEKKGYAADELIGQDGIEEKYESDLKGVNGAEKVQVNASGQTEKVLGKTKPKKGRDVYLTIDLGLQQAAEEGLKKTITAMQYGGTVASKYGASNTAEAAPNAKSGAVVAIDVKTGDVLALANYPDFDPNLFAEGISSDDWDKLQSDNPRDPLAATPLYNMATMSTVQPGSTFKPVTATAGLECGLNPDEYRTDAGAINLGGRTFACVSWNLSNGRTTHGSLNMYRAIGVSCNYYFFDVATGKDWATGGSMGYKKKITYKTITNYAQQYGLGKKTGIQLDEAVMPVPSEKRKVAAIKTQLENELYAAAEEYFRKDVVKNSATLKRDVDSLVALMDAKKLNWNQLYNKTLTSYGIKKSERRKVGMMVMYEYFPQARWTTGDTFNLSIGQGDNSYTPLQMANYIATLGDKGKHHQVSIVSSVQGKGKTRKPKATQVKVDNKKYFAEIIEGMQYVADSSESTVSKTFQSLKVKVAAKTGTAEREGKVNPKSEVAYIKEHLGSIAPNLSWKQVKKEMNRLMKQYPDTYQSEDTAVRRAVINLSKGKVTTDDLDAYKSDYDNFAWVVAMAPADNPRIAVCAMVPQGSTAANAAPIVKEVLGKYFESSEQYTNVDNKTTIQ